MPSILWPDDPVPAAQLGRKAASLAVLQRAGLPVPAWFVVSPEACPPRIVTQGTLEISQGNGARGLRLDAEVVRELEAALVGLAPDGELLAVRSSAPDEDGAGHSFAGQLHRCLVGKLPHIGGTGAG